MNFTWDVRDARLWVLVSASPNHRESIQTPVPHRYLAKKNQTHIYQPLFPFISRSVLLLPPPVAFEPRVDVVTFRLVCEDIE